MTGADATPTRAQERAEQQRARILSAAKKCFIDHGFHAATIANIADEAQVSCGLIYRYFENKNAIVLAIIDRQLTESRENLAALSACTDFSPLFTALANAWKTRDPSVMDPVLFLEMSAEARRAPEIADALRRADRIGRDDCCEWLRRNASEHRVQLEQTELEARALAVQCFLGGLASRIVREPDMDPAVLARMIELVVPAIMQMPRD